VSVTLRLAGPGDAAQLLAAHPDVFDSQPDPSLTRDFLSAPHLHIAIALQDALVIGMCSGTVYHHPDKPPQWWINELGVAGPWRRQGIASRLVALCAQEAARSACAEIWVIADPTPMAEGFWKSLGWQQTGTRLAMFSRSLRA
jgi:GNAT superfamily N-acetyltransferase